MLFLDIRVMSKCSLCAQIPGQTFSVSASLSDTVYHYHPLSPETSPLASPSRSTSWPNPPSPSTRPALSPFLSPATAHPFTRSLLPGLPLLATLPHSAHISLLPPCQQRGKKKLLLISGWPLPLGHILRGSTWLLTWPSAIKTCAFTAYRLGKSQGGGDRCVLMLGWMCVWQRFDRRQTGSLTTAQPSAVVPPSPRPDSGTGEPPRRCSSRECPHVAASV